MGKESNSVGGFSWSPEVKGEGGQRVRGKKESESTGEAGTEKGRKLAFCFHSWDIQSNEHFSREDEWAAVEIMSEVLLQINKSVSQIPIWREF